MKRLTIPDVRVDENTTRRTMIDVEAVREHAMDFYWRLKAYEDTELDPEMCANYKTFEDEAISKGVTFKRIVALMEADRAGLLVVLPCKVGDTVWLTQTWVSERLSQPEAAAVTGAYICGHDVCTFVTDKYGFQQGEIGKTVFLTREEAEKALEAKRNG